MVTESVMTLDAILANVIAQKAEVILQAKVDQLDFTDAIDTAVDNFDFKEHFERAAENALDEFDFEPAVSEALDEGVRDFDFETPITDAIRDADIPQIATEAVQEVLNDQLKDLRERVVAMVAAVAREEVRKALAELMPPQRPSLLSRLLRRLRG